MGLAETAQLAVNLHLGTTGSFKGATAEIGMLETAAGRGTGATGLLAGGLGKAKAAASSFGGAMVHAKNAVGGLLSGPLGILGLGAGVLGLGTILEQTISKTTDFAYSVEKLAGITGLSAEKASALLAVFEKFGISADRAGNIAGFAEKTLGLLADHTTKAGNALVLLDKKFGISLVDAKGHVVDFQTELLKVSDYYTSSASASHKAELAAKLFGRGYADLVPILKLGSKGILEAEQAAKDLGLVLTAQNAKDLKDYRENMRNLGDAVSGLQLQIGLALIPSIEGMAKSITGFVSQNRTSIISFFKEAAHNVGEFAHFLSDDVAPALIGIGSAAKGAWDAIPGGLKDLLIKGFIANKTVKFLFGVDIAGGIGKAIESGLTAGLGRSLATAGIGKLFVQPVFVTNPGFGGSLPGAAVGGAEAAGGFGASAGVAGIATVAAVAAIPIALIAAAEFMDPNHQYGYKAHLATPGGFTGMPINNSPKGGQDMVPNRLANLSAIALSGTVADVIGSALRMQGWSKAAAAIQAAADALRKSARDVEHAWLRTIDPKLIAARSRAAGHDPTKAQVEATRTRDELHQLLVITTKSHASDELKLERLKVLAQDAKDHGDTKTAKKVQSAIDAMKKKLSDDAQKQLVAQLSAAQSLQDIKDKSQSVTVIVNTTVSASSLAKTTTKVQSYGPTNPYNPWPGGSTAG